MSSGLVRRFAITSSATTERRATAMLEMPSFEQAIADPDLLGATPPWPEQHKLCVQLASGRYRTFVVAYGRRSGKDFVSSLWLAYDACLRDLRAYLRPGGASLHHRCVEPRAG